MRRRMPSIGYRKSKRVNLLPYLVLFSLLLLVGWLGWRLFSVLFGGQSVEALSATATLEQGKSEFQLPEQETWTAVQPDQPFYAKDKLQTRPNSRLRLEIEGATMYVNENSQLEITKLLKNKDGLNEMQVFLEQGEIWAKVSDEMKNGKEGLFKITTPMGQYSGSGSIFDVATGSEGDIIRVLAGQATASVITDEEKNETRNISVGVGQKAELLNAEREKIAEGQNVLSGIESSFEESEWHLAALAPFDPQKVTEIRKIIEAKAPKVVSTPKEASTTPEKTKTTEDKKNFTPPSFVSPAKGETVAQNEDEAVVVVGKAAPGTVKVHAKSSLQSLYYTLQKFEEGDTEWRFLVSQEFGSLKFGENIIQVFAEDKDGNTSPVATHTFSYEGAKEDVKILAPDAAPAVNTPQTNTGTSASGIKPPVITNPPRSPFQTAAPVITIRGTVSPGTNAVEINGYRLKAFKLRDTEFQYTANAEYGNMVEGTNEFTVTAFGPGNETATSKVVVIYTPLNLEPETPAVPPQAPQAETPAENQPPAEPQAQTSTETGADIPYNPNLGTE